MACNNVPPMGNDGSETQIQAKESRENAAKFFANNPQAGIEEILKWPTELKKSAELERIAEFRKEQEIIARRKKEEAKRREEEKAAANLQKEHENASRLKKKKSTWHQIKNVLMPKSFRRKRSIDHVETVTETQQANEEQLTAELSTNNNSAEQQSTVAILTRFDNETINLLFKLASTYFSVSPATRSSIRALLPGINDPVVFENLRQLVQLAWLVVTSVRQCYRGLLDYKVCVRQIAEKAVSFLAGALGRYLCQMALGAFWGWLLSLASQYGGDCVVRAVTYVGASLENYLFGPNPAQRIANANNNPEETSKAIDNAIQSIGL